MARRRREIGPFHEITVSTDGHGEPEHWTLKLCLGRKGRVNQCGNGPLVALPWQVKFRKVNAYTTILKCNSCGEALAAYLRDYERWEQGSLFDGKQQSNQHPSQPTDLQSSVGHQEGDFGVSKQQKRQGPDQPANGGRSDLRSGSGSPAAGMGQSAGSGGTQQGYQDDNRQSSATQEERIALEAIAGAVNQVLKGSLLADRLSRVSYLGEVAKELRQHLTRVLPILTKASSLIHAEVLHRLEGSTDLDPEQEQE